MANFWRFCFPLVLLASACHCVAKLNDVEMTALRRIGEAIGYVDSAFYYDPCNSTANITTCDATDTSIIKLSFASMNLTGMVPEAVGSLTNLTSLDLRGNNLVGPIPRGLGNLTRLTYVNLGRNNFNGSLPEELGYLTNLTYFYAYSNQLTGSIPSSIGQLTKIQVFYIQRNYLNGSVPSQLGYCRSLTHLSMTQNAFSGETSFLQELKSLEVLDLSFNQFSGTIFETLQGLTSLTTAFLRKNNFSDSPSFISSNLQYLDLAFNQIKGSIPPNFGGSSLSYLFLSHNNLTGKVPSESFSSMAKLQVLDLSHNSLNGSTNLRTYLLNTEINIAFNYLTDASLKTFSCNFSSPTLLDHCSPSVSGHIQKFAINAGGSESTFENLQFQRDLNRQFGLHFGNDGSQTWAVEITGSEGIVTNANLTKLADIYRSMHTSLEYLAYHASDLQPGTYNVRLYFAEIEGDYIGYRVFDVYIQGRMVKKDLDVFALVQQNAPYNIYSEVEVTSGILSVQLIYDGKSRKNAASSYGGPMISAISAMITAPASKSRSKKIIIGCNIALFAMLVAAAGFVVLWLRKKKRHVLECEHKKNIGVMAYKYATLSKKATNHFSKSSKIGEGGFGSVYKGVLPNGCVIAIKRLHADRTARHEQEFKKEIQLISMVRHQNLVGILGYCCHFHKSVQRFLLVSQYMSNGSLDKQLFSEDENHMLVWEVRYKIALGTASGLAYLHDETELQIIHCDVKPHNILLDEEFNPFLTDFGLARLYDDSKSHVTASRLQGTVGYLAPEYATKYQLSEKVDVYSYGVVLLQLLSGRRVIDLEQMVFLVDWAHELGKSNLEVLMDKRLGDNYSRDEAMKIAGVAILCTNTSASIRPRMRDVRLMLEGIINVPDLQFNSIEGQGSFSQNQTESSSDYRSQQSFPLLY